MRHVRMLGLCLVAIAAIAVVAASSASAGLPEWGQCVAKAGGKYSDANCTTKASKKSGTFEWKKGTAGVAEKKFHGEGGTGVLNAVARICEGKEGSERTKACEEGFEEGKGYEAPIEIECTTEKANGEVAGKDEVNAVAVKFFGCVALGSVECSNTLHEGEVQVNPLKGELGYISKANKEVGVDLTPTKKKGSFAQFDCGGFLGTVVGEAGKAGAHEGGPVYKPKGGGDAIISPITPVNEMTNQFTQTYTTNEADENIPNKFEKGPLQVLESYSYNAEEPQLSWLWGKAGESITNVNTSTEAAEIKA